MSDFVQFSLSYESTGFFSKIVSDYLSGTDTLRPFYQHLPNLEGIKDAIAARKQFNTPRTLLVDQLNKQNAGLELSVKTQKNIAALLAENTFTITTAHQPNIFTGPLYFIYKILHAVKLAEYLSVEMPENNFVPVYYMGSEDADLDEIGSLNVGGAALKWNTKQTGAVGRMKVDKPFLALIHAIEGQIGVQEHGLELIALFKQCYIEGRSIQLATLDLVNQLFADFGVVVLIPDNPHLKSAYQTVIEKELLEGFSQQSVALTAKALEAHYKLQAAGREINLFYLIDDKRERIELQGDVYEVKSLGLQFTQPQILSELDNHPERFSANVILRGGFQETVLPNIAFIGGGGELAYWLELKAVFQKVGIPYPVLILRNSFLQLTEVQYQQMKRLDISVEDLFQDGFNLLNQYVKKQTQHQIEIGSEMEAIRLVYEQLRMIVAKVDTTLNAHVAALQTKSAKRLKELEKKILRAERLQHDTATRQINSLKTSLFPENSLQERVFNMSTFYAAFGKSWMQMVYQASPALSMNLTIMIKG
jgi:bacillithiol biosynthesis cysteine-adding enzyme BshC